MHKGLRIFVLVRHVCFVAACLVPIVASAPARAGQPSVDPFGPPAADPSQAPRAAVTHETPVLEAGQRVRLLVRLGSHVPYSANVVLYHRTLGTDRRFVVRPMPRVDETQAYVTLPALTHQNVGLEYYVLVYDAEGTPIAGIGSRLQPRVAVVPVQERPVAAQPYAAPDRPPQTPTPPPTERVTLPRVFLGLGVGTGIGRARGRAEQTYELYRPGTVGGTYGRAEQTCAVVRWAVAGAPLPSSSSELAAQLEAIDAANARILPASTDEMLAAYDPDLCSRQQRVAPGIASAPLHLAPEVGIRIGERVVVSAFARIQLVTGSHVFGPAPDKSLQASFFEDVTAATPEGVRLLPRFTMAGGIKAKYMFARAGHKLTPFAGGFAGIGAARLRVDLGVSPDRNGNSVADDEESAMHGLLDLDGDIVPESCVAVWPYNRACDPADGEADRTLASAVRASSTRGGLVDTVKLGPAFIGILGGAHWQLARHFGLFGELDLGLWFPGPTTILADIQVGPVVTF